MCARRFRRERRSCVVCAPRVSLTEIKLTCLSRVMTGIRDHTARLHAYKFTLYRAKIMASAFITALPLSITLRGRHSGKNKNPPAKNVGTGRSHTHTGNGFLTMLQCTKWRLLIFASVKFACIFFYLNLHFARVCVYTAVARVLFRSGTQLRLGNSNFLSPGLHAC